MVLNLKAIKSNFKIIAYETEHDLIFFSTDGPQGVCGQSFIRVFNF